MVIKKISKSCHIFQSFSASDCKLLLKKLQTHANNHKAVHAQCKHYTFNTGNWLPVMIDSTTLLISCKINFLSCYGPAAFRPKKKLKKNPPETTISINKILFFKSLFILWTTRCCVDHLKKNHLPRSVL